MQAHLPTLTPVVQVITIAPRLSGLLGKQPKSLVSEKPGHFFIGSAACKSRRTNREQSEDNSRRCRRRSSSSNSNG